MAKKSDPGGKGGKGAGSLKMHGDRFCGAKKALKAEGGKGGRTPGGEGTKGRY